MWHAILKLIQELQFAICVKSNIILLWINVFLAEIIAKNVVTKKTVRHVMTIIIFKEENVS